MPKLKKHTHADRETGTHDARGLKIIQFIAGLNVCRRICGRGEIKNLTERSIEMGAELTSIFTNDSTRVPRHTHIHTHTHTHWIFYGAATRLFRGSYRWLNIDSIFQRLLSEEGRPTRFSHTSATVESEKTTRQVRKWRRKGDSGLSRLGVDTDNNVTYNSI